MSQISAQLTWNEKMQFTAMADNHSIIMDAKTPIGGDAGPTPKQFLLLAMAGCPAMDIVSLLKKYRQAFESFNVEIHANKTEAHPQVFTDCQIRFLVTGPVDPEKFKEAARLSLTKYCGVNAMMTKAVGIQYVLFVNNEQVFEGQANFSI